MSKNIELSDRPMVAEWPFPRRLLEWMRSPELPSLFEDNSMIRVEECTEDGAHVVRAEMPGIDPDQDVDISVEHGMLHLRAERHQHSEQRDHGSLRSEFRYGSFERNLRLPSGATEADVTASYKDGILEVRIPVDEQHAEARKIAVQHL